MSKRKNVPEPVEVERTTLRTQIGPYTAFPNWIIDQCLALLSGDQFKVLAAIIRKTIGWKDDDTGRQKVSDRIAYSQLEELTGLSDDAHSRALDALKRYRLVLTDGKRPGRLGMHYTLQLDPAQVDFATMRQDAEERAASRASKTASARNAPRTKAPNTRVEREKNVPLLISDEELNTRVDREQGGANARVDREQSEVITLSTREQKPVIVPVDRDTIEDVIETPRAQRGARGVGTIETKEHSETFMPTAPLAAPPLGAPAQRGDLQVDETETSEDSPPVTTSPRTGEWRKVSREIERRYGRPMSEKEVEFWTELKRLSREEIMQRISMGEYDFLSGAAQYLLEVVSHEKGPKSVALTAEALAELPF